MKKPRLPFKLLSPPLVLLVVCWVLLLVNLVSVYYFRSFSSDDVSWQNILFTWHPFNGHQVTLGSSDGFVDKIPFFALLEHFFGAGRKLLFLESAILEWLGFTLFYISGQYFMRKAKITLSYVNLLPFVWLASFGYSFSQLYMTPIWRGFEMGVSFAIFMLMAMIYNHELRPLKSALPRLLTVLATVIAGILIYSDPYFLYFTIAPIALFSILLYRLKKIGVRHLIAVEAGAGLCLVFAKITSLLSIAAGIRIVANYPVQFVDIGHLYSNVGLTIHGILIIFGALFFGHDVISLPAISGVLNFLLICLLLYKAFLSQKKHLSKNTVKAWPALWQQFFIGLGAAVILLYVVSTVAVDLGTYRYFIMLVLASVMFLALSMDSFGSLKKPLVAIVILATLFNVGMAKRPAQGFAISGVVTNTNQANTVNFDLVHALQGAGLKKGYANYWQGSINTYLSRNTISVLPIFCPNTKTQPFHWLVDESRFKERASKSFYIVDADFTAPPTCTDEQVLEQFGQPKKMLPVDGRTILIYDYDIGTKMPD